jgi:hypothetical protein
MFICAIITLGCLPVASANLDLDPFPDVPFSLLCNFVHHHFDSNVSLATVLTVLFTITNNPELLNLHARQQNPKLGELCQINTGWIKGLARALKGKLGDATETLFSASEQAPNMSENRVTDTIGLKLDSLSKVLNLYPYKDRQFLGGLKHVSEHEIEPALVICPQSMECETKECGSQDLEH